MGREVKIWGLPISWCPSTKGALYIGRWERTLWKGPIHLIDLSVQMYAGRIHPGVCGYAPALHPACAMSELLNPKTDRRHAAAFKTQPKRQLHHVERFGEFRR
jgi:hypothetical protein